MRYLQDREQSGSGLQGRYYLILGVVFLALTAILLRSSSLQLSTAGRRQISLTRGEGEQMRVQAPRGDIVDVNGRPFAYSEQSQSLYLAFTGQSTAELNHELLDLALILESEGISLESNLPTYFDFAYRGQNRKDQDKEAVPFVFKRDLSEIAQWQQNQDLFGLLPTESEKKGEKIKLQAEDFYQYLLYEVFDIEQQAARGSRRYSRAEAYRIMCLRYTLMEHNWTYQQGEPVCLAKHLTKPVIAQLQEQNERFQGCLLLPTSERAYAPEALYAAHVLGYTGVISGSEYEKMKDYGYGVRDQVGKAGIEYAAERYLHGQDGVLPYGTWLQDKEGRRFQSGRYGLAPEAGAEIKLTLDREIQKRALASLLQTIDKIRERELGAATSAAVVAMNVKTGAIISMASVPTYDPRDFLNRAPDREVTARLDNYLKNQEQKPLLNRALGEIYAPGSTFKPMTSLAGIMEGVIAPDHNTYSCNGEEMIGYKLWACFEEPIKGHGPLTLSEALVTSCNLYFYKLGIDIGIDKLSKWCEKFGLGEYTGIDLPGEAKGIRPSRELKRQTRSKAEDQEWYPADTCQTAIGQFDHAYTLVQLARAVSGVASGKLPNPHVIKEIRAQDGSLIRAEQIQNEDIGLTQTAIDMVRDGMRQLKASGHGQTSVNFGSYPIDVSAKTGTAELGATEETLKTNALFVCYAPSDDPEIAIAAVVESGGRGDYTSTIARDILDAYFDLPLRDELTPWLKDLDIKKINSLFRERLEGAANQGQPAPENPTVSPQFAKEFLKISDNFD